MAKDPFALLKEDHRQVEKLFKEIEDTTERAEKTRRDLFDKIKQALDEHTMLEETIVYPVLEEVDITHDLTLEGEEEHNVVKLLLEELDMGDETTEEWTAKMAVLQENVEHHVEEEENELFPKAEKAMSEDQLGKLAEDIEANKASE